MYDYHKFSELPDTSNPKSVMFWRKTKAGRWENVETRWYRQGYNKANIALICNRMANCEICSKERLESGVCNYGDKHRTTPYKIAYKATTVKGKQIYSTEYTSFLSHCDALGYTREQYPDYGIMIDKKQFIPYKNIGEWLKNLSAQHNGIKNWKEAAKCKDDNYLTWGHLICNDGFKVSVAFIGLPL